MSTASGAGLRWLAAAFIIVLLGPLTVEIPHADAAPGRPPADVVFVFDESGSMGADQRALAANVEQIAGQLDEYVDPRFALVGFGAGTNHGSPAGYPHTHTDFTDLASFRSALGQLTTSGAFEPGVLATTYAMQQLQGFRSGANTCVVLVTDEDSDGGNLAQARAALDSRNAVWFGIVQPGVGNTPVTYGPNAGSLSDHTGGAISSIRDFRANPEPILQALVDRCAAAAALPPGAENLGHRRGASLIVDPVNTATGNFVETYTDLAFPPSVLGLDVTRTYNALDGSAGALGQGWSGPFSTSLTTLPTGEVILAEADGRRLRLTPDASGAFTRPPELFADLQQLDDGTFELRYDDGTVWAFTPDGLPTGLRDWTGQEVAFSHDGAGNVVAASSSTGYRVDLAYDDSKLVRATADDGRTVAYRYGADGNLAEVVRVDGGVETYQTDEQGRVTEVTDPDGRRVVANTYDSLGRVVRQTDASGGVVELSYPEAGTTIVVDHRTSGTTTFVHDDAGRPRAVTDAGGAVARFVYDEDGNLLEFEDRRGAVTRRTFDGHGNVLTATDPTGGVTTYAYDDQQRLVEVIDPAGGLRRLTYEDAERLPSAIVDPTGGTRAFDIVDGLLLATTDADGIEERFSYDARRNLVALVDGAGETTTVGHDDAGNVARIVLPSGATTRMERDPAGRVTRRIDADGSATTYTYAPGGALLGFADDVGTWATYTYDAAGRLATQTDGNGDVHRYVYDDAGRLVQQVAPGDAVTTYSYGVMGRLERVVDPEGVTTEFGYDATGAVTTVTDATGAVTTTVYDGKGRPVDRTDADGNVTQMRYDAMDRLQSVVAADGATTRYGYDPAGRLLEVTDPRGAVSTRTYTPGGRLASATDPLGATTTLDYDDAGRLVGVTDPEGGRTAYAYDVDGRLVAQRSPAGRATSFHYDEVGNIEAVTQPDGGTTTFRYTARHMLAGVTDPTGATASFTWDPAGNLVEAIDPNGGVTTFDYDGRGNRIGRTDQLGSTERWAYDLADRLVAHTDPLGEVTRLAYDSAGRLALVEDPTDRSVALSYDERGLLQARTFGDGSQVRFGYDVRGRRTSMVDGTGTTSYRYGPAGELLGVERPDGTTTSYAYDLAGRRVSTGYPDGTEALASYDARGLLTELAHPTWGRATYAYDADGLLLGEDLPGADARSYVRDPAGRISGFLQEVDGRLSDVGLTWDEAGRLASETSGGQKATYRYDDAGQLRAVDVAGGHRLGPGGGATANLTGELPLTMLAGEYSYDAAGRRTDARSPRLGTRAFTYDAAHRLIAVSDDDGTTTVRYDDAGRRIEEDGPDGTVRYGYDPRGLLASVDRRRDGELIEREERRYDGAGQLVELSTSSGRVSRTTSLTWDAQRPVPQLLELERSVDAPGRNDVDERVSLLQAAGPTGFVRSSGTTGSFALDPRRSVVETATSTDLVAASVYDAFGVPIESAAGRSTDPLGELGFRGELATPGGVHLRAREYDPATASFLTQDPLDGVPGTTVVANPYHYAGNDPVNLVDPLGLSPLDDDWFGLGATPRDLGITEEILEQGGFDVLTAAGMMAGFLGESLGNPRAASRIADAVEDFFEDGLGRIPGGIGGRLGSWGDPVEDFLRRNASTIGKIAKFGGSVLDGVEFVTTTLEYLDAGHTPAEAILRSSLTVGGGMAAGWATFAVCTSATLGFGVLPCAGAGAVAAWVGGTWSGAGTDWLFEGGPGRLWDTATDWGSTAWDTATDWGSSAWDTATDWGSSAWNTATDWGSSAWDTATDWGSSVLDASTDIGSGIVDTVSGWFDF